MRGRKIVRKYTLRSRYKWIVNTMRYNKAMYTARRILKSPKLSEATVREITRTIKQECATLCKMTSQSSFRVKTIADLLQFDWVSLLQELKNKAPLFTSVLKAAAEGATHRTPDVAVIGMAASVLLKSRCKHMCKLQMMVSSLLYAGHASKRVGFAN